MPERAAVPQFHIPPYPKRADSINDLISPEAAAVLDQLDEDGSAPIHSWFELTYSNYLVLPRALLQSMPLDWQTRFVRCLRELRHVTEAAGVETAARYDVHAKDDETGRYVSEPVPRYNRGRTQLDLTPKDQADA